MSHSYLSPTCSECGASLKDKDPRAKTCGPTCRRKRSRRLQKANDEAKHAEKVPEHQRQVAAIVRRETPELAHKVIQEELRPIVREAITEEVLRSIHDLVGLTPRAIQAISEDLESDNAAIRQRAYRLVTQYTMGHPALVRPEEVSGEKQLVVHFNLPRPETPAVVEAEPDAESYDDTKTCDVCGRDLPESMFVDNSDRCRECWERMRSEVMERFGTDA